MSQLRLESYLPNRSSSGTGLPATARSPRAPRRRLPSASALLALLALASAVPALTACNGDTGTGSSMDMTKLPTGTCTASTDCTGSTPVCDATVHRCVGCVMDTDCNSNQVCNTASKTCTMGCQDDSGCSAPNPKCDPTSKMCVACEMDSDCASPTAFCNTSTKSCVECLPDNDQCPAMKYCDSNTFKCVDGCKADTDCQAKSGSPAAPDDGGTDDAGTADMATAGDMAVEADMAMEADMGMSMPADASAPRDMAMGGGMDGGTTPPNPDPYCEVTRHACVQCTQDSQCPLGQICKGNTCQTGCSNTHGCAGGQTCCSVNSVMTCVDTTSDPDNCGGCGATNQNFVCKGGWSCCGSACSDVATDPNNCGKCGKVCSGKDSVQTCSARQCVISMCTKDQGDTTEDCDNKTETGCETDLSSDVNHCGSCTKVCTLPHASAVCTSGSCAVGLCDNGYGDCNGDPTDGCEKSTLTDPNNCGGCGMVCNLPNADAACSNGGCTIARCHAGYKDCDGDPSNGCEVQTDADVNNCGACGKACPVNHDTVECDTGVCKISACDTGYADCSGGVTDGCEANTNTDANHCGQCNVACATTCSTNVTTSSCNNGLCQVTACNPGYHDVNNSCSDGCECQETTGNGTTCQAPLDLGHFAVGTTGMTTYYNVTGAEDWFVVTFDGRGDLNFHPSIAISTNTVDNVFRMDLFSACGTPLSCGMETSKNSTGLQSWDVQYDLTTNPDPASKDMSGTLSNFQPIAFPSKADGILPDSGTVLIRIYPTLSHSCEKFGLTVANTK